ncbi:MAG: VVA0879 family protein, partial [Lysobacter sp.]
GMSEPEDYAFICPMCECVQSARDLIAAGAGSTFHEVQGLIGFSCVGRLIDAPSPRHPPDGKPCNWTLGGLLRTHRLEILDRDGKAHPRFELATPEQASDHAARGTERAA